ncbi:MAG TPA: hypothetical protein DCY79_08530 [Planctomycetaceae bacterium]|nr:hypothetical protein [Blastopirellula sp.]HAY79837.1 hypothetical protein [Planctomycetaceae bacterium]
MAIQEAVPTRLPADTEGSAAHFGSTVRVDNRRTTNRYELSRPIVAIPFAVNGEPDTTLSAEGMTTDMSAGGLALEIPGLRSLPTKRVVVGVEASDGKRYYATLEAKSTKPTQDGLRVGGSFLRDGEDPLHPMNVVPMLDPVLRRLKSRTPESTLQRWAEVGVLVPKVCDKVLVCPRCRALPTLREGCRRCGSSRVLKDNLIHHFACAYVGPASEFKQDGQLVCPKCQANRLVVGADFEHIPGAYRCEDCQHTDNERDHVAQCLSCDLRFPISQAHEEDVIAFHVERLDPVALLASIE